MGRKIPDMRGYVSQHVAPPGVVATSRIDGMRVHLRRLSEDDGGGFLAEVLEMPGCATDGETVEAALSRVRDAMAGWRAMDEKLRGEP